MRKYELLFITHPDYDDEKVAAVIQRYQDVVTRAKGVVATSEKWGKRRLAYELDGLREGLYILVTFEAEREVASEIDRLMKIDGDVVRHMLSRIDHPRRKITPRKPLRETRTEGPRVEPSGESAPPVRVVREAAEEKATSAKAPSEGPETGDTTPA